jgi:hypothetical protein
MLHKPFTLYYSLELSLCLPPVTTLDTFRLPGPRKLILAPTDNHDSGTVAITDLYEELL